MHIGFIGLGAMGQAIAANLLKAGHTVTVWNRSPQAAEALVGQGAKLSASPVDAFAAEVIFSILADDTAVRSVIVDSGAVAALAAPKVHVNMATISVALADTLAALHREAGASYIAAPVVGRPNVAAAGQLQILAAGPAAAMARVQPLFDVIGKKTWALGETPSQANAMKLAVNFMLASAIETMGEASALVRAFGMEASTLIELINTSIFPGPVYQGYGGQIAARQYEPAGFKVPLGLKDVRLALAAAESRNVPLPIASVARDALIDALAHGEAEKDWAVLGEGSMRRAGLA